MGTIKKSTVWAFLPIIFYKITLDISYFFLISPIWGYMKLESNFNAFKFIESYFLLFIVFILMPKSSKKLSSIMVWLLILLSYVPMLTFFALSDQSRAFMYAVTGFWIMTFMLLKFPNISWRSLKQKQSKIIRFLIFFLVISVILLIILKYFGLSFNFDLRKVYEIRAKYVEMQIPLAAYLFFWLGNIINPVLFAIFVAKRKWFYAGLIFILQVLLFSVTGHKHFLFALPFVLILMWVIKRKNPLAYTAIGLIAIILLGMLSYLLISDLWIASLFTRRVLIVPAQLNFFYYDFFSQNSFVYLSYHRIFRLFSHYPYELSPPHLIGEVYFDKPERSANSGLYADAFMNFGFTGLILWSIFLVIILKFVDAFSKDKNIQITIAIIAIPVLSLISSAFFTNLLSHGLLLALLILYLLPKQHDYNR